MPVDHKSKYCFIHIPKNAGSTIESALGLWRKHQDTAEKERLVGLISNIDKCRYGLWREREWQHISAIQAKKIIGAERWKDYFTFAVVRNPWDRMVSWYHYLNRKVDFSQWILSLDSSNSHVSRARLMKSQTDYISNIEGEIIVDKVIRFEDFNAQFKQIYTMLGFELGELPHIRKSNRRPYKEYYSTPESIEIVRERCAKDINKFEYEF